MNKHVYHGSGYVIFSDGTEARFKDQELAKEIVERLNTSDLEIEMESSINRELAKSQIIVTEYYK